LKINKINEDTWFSKNKINEDQTSSKNKQKVPSQLRREKPALKQNKKNVLFTRDIFIVLNKLFDIGTHVFKDTVKIVHKKYSDADILTNGDYFLYDKNSTCYKDFTSKLKNGNYDRLETKKQLIIEFQKYGGHLFIKECNKYNENAIPYEEVINIISNISKNMSKCTYIEYYKIITEDSDLKNNIKSMLSSVYSDEILNFVIKTEEEDYKDTIEYKYPEMKMKSNKCCHRFRTRFSISPLYVYVKFRDTNFHLSNPQVRKYIDENNIDILNIHYHISEYEKKSKTIN